MNSFISSKHQKINELWIFSKLGYNVLIYLSMHIYWITMTKLCIYTEIGHTLHEQIKQDVYNVDNIATDRIAHLTWKWEVGIEGGGGVKEMI